MVTIDSLFWESTDSSLMMALWEAIQGTCSLSNKVTVDAHRNKNLTLITKRGYFKKSLFPKRTEIFQNVQHVPTLFVAREKCEVVKAEYSA